MSRDDTILSRQFYLKEEIISANFILLSMTAKIMFCPESVAADVWQDSTNISWKKSLGVTFDKVFHNTCLLMFAQKKLCFVMTQSLNIEPTDEYLTLQSGSYGDQNTKTIDARAQETPKSSSAYSSDVSQTSSALGRLIEYVSDIVFVCNLSFPVRYSRFGIEKEIFIEWKQFLFRSVLCDSTSGRLSNATAHF